MSASGDDQTQAATQPLSAGFSLGKYLQLLPGGARLAGFAIMAFMGMAGYLVYSASGIERILVILLVFALLGGVIGSAHALQRQERAIAEQQQQALEGKIVLDAPKLGSEKGERIKFDYDLFVAAPMASLPSEEQRAAFHRGLLGVLEDIKSCCHFEIFFAGYKADKPANFDPPAMALKLNVPRMRASKRFMLIYSENIPTSALLEVGMALGLGKPSVWFVKKGIELPYLMRGANAAAQIPNFPPILIYEFNDLAQISQYIKSNGTTLFEIERRG